MTAAIRYSSTSLTYLHRIFFVPCQGLNAAIVLWVSTTLNQFLEQGMWQRIFASQSTRDARLGLFFGGLLTVPTVTLFASIGIFANAATQSGVIEIIPGTESTAFFVVSSSAKI